LVFLRLYRHELFDEGFLAELAGGVAGGPTGQPPVPPAQRALATLLQAYARVSDDEVSEAAVTGRRWQLVLDCLGAEQPPFARGTLVGFCKRLIGCDLDRVLVERSVRLAAATKGFGARALQAALDSAALWGAGRVEDTFTLMGHALRKALGVIAVLQGRGQAAGTAAVAAQAGVPQLAASSLKARWTWTGTARPPAMRPWPRCWACWIRWQRSWPARPAVRRPPQLWRG
jgi:hypothetical protein